MTNINRLLGLALVVSCVLPCACAQTSGTDAPALLDHAIASTHSTVLADGVRVDYDAVFDELALRSANGTLQASITSTTYLRRGVASASRPVVFLFNGGPGASSSPLHFTALGPRRFVEDDKGVSHLQDNPRSLLDVADLVFVDPVGTGFSQAYGDSSSNPYWSPRGDARAVAELVHDWLRKNHREKSPLYVIGESYGGFRAAMLMRELDDVQVSGLVLISPLLDASAASPSVGNDMPHILDLPTMAVAAWTQGRADKTRNGTTAAAVFDTAARFALGDYALALLQGSALADAQRRRIAERLSELIGIPAQALVDAQLRIDSEKFLNTVLGDGTRRVGRLDTRVVGSAAPPVTSRPSNDPSLPQGGTSPRIEAYMHDELGVALNRRYFSLNFDVNRRWNWQSEVTEPGHFYVNSTGYIGDAMHRNPAMRVLATGGYYDMAVPLLGTTYALQHGGLPIDRVTVLAFDSAHSPYDTPADFKRFSDAVRQLVAH